MASCLILTSPALGAESVFFSQRHDLRAARLSKSNDLSLCHVGAFMDNNRANGSDLN